MVVDLKMSMGEEHLAFSKIILFHGSGQIQLMIFRPEHAVALLSSFANEITTPTWGLFSNRLF